jgi:hypothetical protein
MVHSKSLQLSEDLQGTGTVGAAGKAQSIRTGGDQKTGMSI